MLLALLLAAAPLVQKRGATHVLVLPPAMPAALDAVIAGRGSARAVLVCVMSEAAGFRAFEIKPWMAGSDAVLYHQDRGRIEQPVADAEEQPSEPLELATEAFQIVFPERASVLYYWSGGKFRKYITSD